MGLITRLSNTTRPPEWTCESWIKGPTCARPRTRGILYCVTHPIFNPTPFQHFDHLTRYMKNYILQIISTDDPCPASHTGAPAMIILHLMGERLIPQDIFLWSAGSSTNRCNFESVSRSEGIAVSAVQKATSRARLVWDSSYLHALCPHILCVRSPSRDPGNVTLFKRRSPARNQIHLQ